MFDIRDKTTYFITDQCIPDQTKIDRLQKSVFENPGCPFVKSSWLPKQYLPVGTVEGLVAMGGRKARSSFGSGHYP